jgi:hypothetical protein
MINIKDIMYLEWILNRLSYKFKDKPEYIQEGRNILKKITNPSIEIDDEVLDKILSKYFIDFNLDKTSSIGYDQKDRENLRSSVRGIVWDILHKNIPNWNEILIK